MVLRLSVFGKWRVLYGQCFLQYFNFIGALKVKVSMGNGDSGIYGQSQGCLMRPDWALQGRVKLQKALRLSSGPALP